MLLQPERRGSYLLSSYLLSNLTDDFHSEPTGPLNISSKDSDANNLSGMQLKRKCEHDTNEARSKQAKGSMKALLNKYVKRFSTFHVLLYEVQ